MYISLLISSFIVKINLPNIWQSHNSNFKVGTHSTNEGRRLVGCPIILLLRRHLYLNLEKTISNPISHVIRKPVFGVFNQVRLKPAWSATEASKSHGNAGTATTDIELSRQQTTKAVIRLGRCGHDTCKVYKTLISKASRLFAPFFINK